VTTQTDSELFLVDSSGWIEYLGDNEHADFFAPYLNDEKKLLIPTTVLYEVFKKLLRDGTKTAADAYVSRALRCRMAPLDEGIALAAVHVSLDSQLAMADAIIYATSRAFHAKLITTDRHFRGLPDVVLP
jgi:predicted nucleic acid-binding protein